jgi:hypothetical protein
MRNRKPWRCLVLLLVLNLSLVSCVSNKLFSVEDLTSLELIKVVRHETPNIRIIINSGTLYDVTRGKELNIITVGLGSGAASNMLKSISDNMIKAKSDLAANDIFLPDFGELVMKRFSERVADEVPRWPKMEVDNQPVDKKFKYRDGILIEFDVVVLDVKWPVGLVTEVVGTMKDSRGRTLWQKNYFFTDHNREWGAHMGDYFAYNGKYLREELLRVADLTVTDFITHFKGTK